MRGVFNLILMLGGVLALAGSPFKSVAAKDLSLIDTAAITSKFENSMAIAKETLRRFPPPRYLIYKVVVTFSITDGLDGAIEGKIPVGLVSIGFKGDYEQVKTKKQTFTYVPNTAIPTNVEDFGVLAFIIKFRKNFLPTLRNVPS